jgi:hypothetical protein
MVTSHSHKAMDIVPQACISLGDCRVAAMWIRVARKRSTYLEITVDCTLYSTMSPILIQPYDNSGAQDVE